MAKQTMQEAGFEFVGWGKHHGVVVRETGTSHYELWTVARSEAAAGFHWRGHAWEFSHEVVPMTAGA